MPNSLLITWLSLTGPLLSQQLENPNNGFLSSKANTSIKEGNPKPLGPVEKYLNF